MTYATPEHAAAEKKATVETVVKLTGQRYAKHFYKFEITKISSFKSNEAWFQTNILYGLLPLSLRVMKPGSKYFVLYISTFVQSNGILLYILYANI